MMDLIKKYESKIAAMRKKDLQEGQKHLDPLKKLFHALGESDFSKKDKVRLMAEIASMLGDCNFWIARFDRAGQGQKAQFYAEARYWYETAYYMLDYVGCQPYLGDHLSDIGFTLDPIEQTEIKARYADIREDTFGYLTGHGFTPVIQIENRLEALPEDDHNHRALLLLKKAGCIYELKLQASYSHQQNSPLSSDVMAYEICKEILQMQDDGIDLWPGIVHRVIVFILLRYPKIDYGKMDTTARYEKMKKIYEEFRHLLERGLANAEDMVDERFRKQIIDAFASAAHGLEFIDSPRLVLR